MEPVGCAPGVDCLCPHQVDSVQISHLDCSHTLEHIHPDSADSGWTLHQTTLAQTGTLLSVQPGLSSLQPQKSAVLVQCFVFTLHARLKDL